MKFPVHSSRPALVYACALSLFPTLAWAQHYQQANLVSNAPVTPAASITDPNLTNAWGLVHGPTTPWWISNNAGGTSTLYNTSGLNPGKSRRQTPAPVLAPVSIVALNAPGGTPGNGVKIPNAPSQPAPGSPTAVMFNGSTTDFLLAPGKPAAFLFTTLDGTIQAWNSSCECNHCGHRGGQFPSPQQKLWSRLHGSDHRRDWRKRIYFGGQLPHRQD